MDIIIFSKDRAAQLDLCIRSIKEYVSNPKITVLLTWSNQEYLDGYAKLLHKHFDVTYIEQGNFMRTLRRLVNESSDYVIMMVDDSVFIHTLDNWDIRESEQVLGYPDIKCFSLMLSPYISYNYSHGFTYQSITLKRKYSFNYWDWTDEHYKSDWGYPHQVGGNLWDKKYLKKILRFVRAKNPNELECKLNFPLRKRRYSTPLMGCFHKSRILNVPINYIPKKEKENRNSGLYSLEYLNNKFINGYQIKLPKGIKSNAINKEIEIEFEKV